MINKLPEADQQAPVKSDVQPANHGPHFKPEKVKHGHVHEGKPAYALANQDRPDLKDHELNPKPDLSTRIIMLHAVLLPFIGCFIAGFLMWNYGWMGWPYLAMVVIGWTISSLGITVGFHRLMSHKSFETYGWVRATWMVIGSLSVEGSPLVWCAVHRRHHGHSDQDGDPHSPHLHGDTTWGMIKGLAHAQVGWLFSGHWSKPDLEKYVPDLLKDKTLIFLDKFYLVVVLISLLVPTALGYCIEYWSGGSPWFGALLGFTWGGLVRIFVGHHITWSINSICHVWGKRHFHSNDHSTNNALCGVLAMGEGWHNNHHAFPSSAKHGLLWYQFDMSWLVIRSMQAVGLAWDVRLPSERALNSKRIQKE